MTNDNPVAGTLIQLAQRRDDGTIKPRQFDMVVRELLRTVTDTTRRKRAAEPEPEPDPIRYPHVRVPLLGENGHGLVIAARTRSALRAAGVEPDECERYFHEALSGNYTHLLVTTREWVNTEQDPDI